MEECLFCKWKNEREKDFIYDNDNFFAVFDGFKASQGHTLIIPKRHVNSLDDLTEQEQKDLFSALKEVKAFIDKEDYPDGYNYGVNEGNAAGQTIMHLHVHLIPRYRGDVENPRGGVRNIIPGKGDYRENGR